MTFAAWCDQNFAGTQRISDLPLPDLHPLRQFGFGIELEVRDGLIVDCRFDIASIHRGDEKLLEVRDFRQGLALVQRHSWLTATFAEVLYARAIEISLGMTISERAAALRALALQLNWVATEALWAHLDAEIAGVPSDALVKRERVLDALEALTGARMHTTFARIGGVAADVPEGFTQLLARIDDPRVHADYDAVTTSTGALQVQLPKVLRLPQGDAYAEIETPHGSLGCWVFGSGDKVPHRVHMKTPGFAALAALERDAIGAIPREWFMKLAHTRLVLGEVAR